jgi:hypothetical protein
MFQGKNLQRKTLYHRGYPSFVRLPVRENPLPQIFFATSRRRKTGVSLVIRCQGKMGV